MPISSQTNGFINPQYGKVEARSASHGPDLPAGAGIGFKAAHFDDLVEGRHRPAFLEIHAENYMGAGGLPHYQLTRLRELYPLSLHGVGLSIGGEDPLDRAHLTRLRHLVDRYQPHSFSEHLAWSSHGTNFYNDLLPIAYEPATLRRVCDHIDAVQDALKMRMLLENPSTYVAFASSSMDEITFLGEIAARTGCGLLLDVNNVQVSSINHARDPFRYIDAFPMERVGEIHLGGHAEETDEVGGRLLIDSHDRLVDPEVWALFARALHHLGPVPTLIEWDNDVPALDTLMSEAERADVILAESQRWHASTQPRHALSVR